MSYGLIQDRASFRNVLADAKARTAKLLSKSPENATLGNIANQLEAMDTTTRDGRNPTREEQKSIDVGLVVVRELDPIEGKELAELAERLHMLNAYYEDWPESRNPGDAPPWLPEGDDDDGEGSGAEPSA